MRSIAAALAFSVALSSCATVPPSEHSAVATATMISTEGRTLGTVALRQSGDGYRLSGTFAGLAPGEHGMHLHAAGKCDTPSFASAGPHLNPSLHQHGTMNPQGAHLGDLPNILVDASGHAAIVSALRGTRSDLDQDLFDADGTALVIHAEPDDYRTDPSGNSGPRIACGILIRS